MLEILLGLLPQYLACLARERGKLVGAGVHNHAVGNNHRSAPNFAVRFDSTGRVIGFHEGKGGAPFLSPRLEVQADHAVAIEQADDLSVGGDVERRIDLRRFDFAEHGCETVIVGRGTPVVLFRGPQ